MKVKSNTQRVCSECGFKTMLTLVDDKMSIISSKNIASSVFDWSELPHHIIYIYIQRISPLFTPRGCFGFLSIWLFQRKPSPNFCPLVSTSSHDWRLGARGLSLSSYRDLGSELQFPHWTQLPQGPPCHGTLPVVCLVRNPPFPQSLGFVF